MAGIVVIVLGALALALEVVAFVGLVAMRDTYDRLHYVGLASLGAVPLGAGVLVAEGPSLIAIKAGLVAFLLLVTTPVMTHATARALHHREREEH